MGENDICRKKNIEPGKYGTSAQTAKFCCLLLCTFRQCKCDLSYLQVCIPLFYEPAAGLGSKGGTEESGQEEVVGTLTLLRSTFLEMKAKQQQQQGEEEKEQALFKEINAYFKSLLCNHYLFHHSSAVTGCEALQHDI